VSTLATFRAKIDSRLKEAAAKLSDGDKDAAITAALAEFSAVRPRHLAELVTGAAAFDYALDGATPKLTAWRDGFSVVEELIYPWSATTATPPTLDSDEYMVVRLSTGLFLRFLGATPTAAQQFHVVYTSPHAIAAASSTVAATDEEALANLAAAYACEALASFYSQSTDPAFNADTTNHLSKAQEYRAQAKRWRDAYRAAMGFDQDAAGAAAGVATVVSAFDNAPSRDRFFFHGRR
jgi:hypothetical protein